MSVLFSRGPGSYRPGRNECAIADGFGTASCGSSGAVGEVLAQALIFESVAVVGVAVGAGVVSGISGILFDLRRICCVFLLGWQGVEGIFGVIVAYGTASFCEDIRIGADGRVRSIWHTGKRDTSSIHHRRGEERMREKKEKMEDGRKCGR